MNEADTVCEILERMQSAFTETEETMKSILRILSQIESIEKIMEENHE